MKLTRQEEAFNFVAQTFVKLIEQDKRVAHKEEVMAFWADFFEHGGIRDNMIQAFENFLWEIDGKMDSARKAGIVSVKEAIETEINLEGYSGTTEHLDIVSEIIEDLLAAEEIPEENISESDVANMDLSEVGGGHEDDTSPI